MGEGTGAAVSDDQTTPRPAADADEAVRQARDIRAQVDQDLRALEARLPDPSTVQARAKTIGGAVAGGVSGLGALVLILKRRSAKNAEEEATRKQAAALAAALPDAALELRQEHVTVSGKAGRAGLVLALVALGVAVWSKVSGGDEAEPDIWGPDAPA